MAEGRDPGTLFDAIRDFSENASPLDFVLIAQHWQMFLTGVGYTVVLVAVSLVIGGAISLPLAVARANRTPIANQVIWAYVYLFRGTPLLVQLYIIYYGLGQFEFVRESFLWPVLREPLWCTLIAFVLNTAAYTTEIFRGAIEAVPYGEVEAAKAYGMSGRLPHDPGSCCQMPCGGRCPRIPTRLSSCSTEAWSRVRSPSWTSSGRAASSIRSITLPTRDFSRRRCSTC